MTNNSLPPVGISNLWKQTNSIDTSIKTYNIEYVDGYDSVSDKNHSPKDPDPMKEKLASRVESVENEDLKANGFHWSTERNFEVIKTDEIGDGRAAAESEQEGTEFVHVEGSQGEEVDANLIVSTTQGALPNHFMSNMIDETYGWIYSTALYNSVLEIISSSPVGASLAKMSGQLMLLNATRYGAVRACVVPLPPPLLTSAVTPISATALLLLNIYIQDGFLPDGSIPRYQARKDKFVSQLLKGQAGIFLKNVAESTVYIRNEQLFEDGNHRTACLFTMETCANVGLALKRHPFEIYVIISNLDEVSWNTVKSRLFKWLERSWKHVGVEESLKWRKMYARLIKEIPFWNTLIRHVAKILNNEAYDYKDRKALAVQLKRCCPQFYRWGKTLLKEDFAVKR
jgi:hypothetical protein